MDLLSADQLVAVKLFGAKEVVRDGLRILEPAYGRKAVVGLLRLGYVQDDAVMERVMNEAGMTDVAKEILRREKVVVRHTESDGSLELLHKIPGVTDDNISEYTASEFGVEDVHDVVDERPLKYKLHNLFNDVTLADKLRISSRRMQVAKRLAVSDPAAASASLTEYIRSHGFPAAVVQAGDYARSIARMRRVIFQYADTIVYRDTAAPALVVLGDLYMTFEGFEDIDKYWTVRGPLKHAAEVQAIYQLTLHYGPQHVMFILGLETVFLGIQIRDDRTGLYIDGQLEGYSSLDGIKPVGADIPTELTADQRSRMLSVADKVSPVMVDGRVIGTAVHVTDRHCILSEHTLTDAADVDSVAVVQGEVVHDWRSVGNDVAMVKRVAVSSAKWVLRAAEVSERVVLCYSVGDAVEYSEVLRVMSITPEHIILSDSLLLRKGASGAVVVALRDSALLGVFTSKRNSTVICSVFDSSSFLRVNDFESLASSEYPGTPGVTAGTQTYLRMQRKGFQGFLEGINDAVAPLYVERYGVRSSVGLVANVAGRWLTTVDPDHAQLLLQDGMALRTKTLADGRFVVVDPPPLLKAVPNVRTAEPGERVFLFTREADDVAMTSVGVVVHSLADDRAFSVEDFGENEIQLMGALVVAERDCAVVGQYQSRGLSAYGDSVVHCVSVTLADNVVPSRPDRGAVMGEVQRVLSAGEGRVAEYASVGRTAVEIIGKRRAMAAGMSLEEGGRQAIQIWDVDNRRIVESLGFDMSNWSQCVGQEFRSVAEVVLGALMLSDPGSWVSSVRLLAPEVVADRTPITGEFPFSSRPASVVSSVASGVTVTDIKRIQDLEGKYEELRRQMLEAFGSIT